MTTFRADSDAEVNQIRPTVDITSPSEQIVTITGPACGVTLNLEGTAPDIARGVARVELKIDDSDTVQLVSAYTPATATGPAGEDDYSIWENDLIFDEEGTYRVTARATDEAENQNWQHVIVEVELD